MKPILLFLFFLLLFPGRLLAFNTGNCHCFRHRNYDVQNKFAADDYLLTTGYNSLIAHVFAISKRTIIMKKMKGGINGDDLVIGLYIQEKTGKPLDLLLSVRDNGGSWQQILVAAGSGQAGSNDPIMAAIAAGDNRTTVHRMITDFMLKSRYSCPQTTIAQLRSSGLTGKKINLLLAFHEQTGVSLKKLGAMITGQKMSWSELAHHFGLTPKDVGQQILKDANPQLR